MPKLEVVNANNVIEYSPQKANFKLKNTGGPKGEPGAQGPKGDTGPQGPAGPQGIQGEKGDKGAQGERGPQGIQGPQGPQGIQGPKGDKGDKGNTGATGPQGPQGPAGQNGTDGQDGADGFSPIATVTQEGLNAEISITDKDGTTTATVPGFGVQVVESLPATGTENVIYLKRTESTASGTSITVSDAVEAPLSDFKLNGETSQNGTPTPDAPIPVQTVTGENVVQICGKNLLEMPIESGSSNGITWTVQDDGSIILNGTSTAGVSIRANNVTIPAVEGETYTLSATGMGEAYNFGYKNSSSGENIFVVTSASPTTTAVVTSTMLSQANRLDMYIQSGKTFNNQRVTLQLELGSTATAYEPYQGQSYEVNLGKNLFNIAGDLSYGGYPISPTNNGDGTLTTTANYNSQRASGQKINCISGKTYTVSGKLVSHTGTGNTSVVEILSGLIGGVSVVKREYITADGSFSYSFVAPADVSKLWISFSTVGADTQATFGDIQIELGSTATSYAAYFEPIELCKIGDYQDSIYKSDGKWYVHKEIGKLVQNGTETGWYNLSGSTSYARTSAATSFVKNVSFFANRGLTTPTSGTRIKIPNNNLYWYETGYESIEAFKSSLATTNLIVYAPLATPTDTEITNQALVAQLEAILSQGYTYAGTNNITTVISAGNEQGELEIGYYNAYDSYLYVAGRWQQFARLTAANE